MAVTRTVHVNSTVWFAGNAALLVAMELVFGAAARGGTRGAAVRWASRALTLLAAVALGGVYQPWDLRGTAGGEQ